EFRHRLISVRVFEKTGMPPRSASAVGSATGFGDRPPLALVEEPDHGLVRGQPQQLVVRFARARPADHLAEEEGTALAVMLPPGRGGDQLVRHAKAAAEHDPQAALLLDLADGRILRPLPVVLAAARQR